MLISSANREPTTQGQVPRQRESRKERRVQTWCQRSTAELIKWLRDNLSLRCFLSE